MKDKLHEYALIAEIIGGIAIVLSLLFVGIQINQNSESTQAQTRDSLSEKQIELYLQLGLNARAMEIYTRGRAGLIEYDFNDPEYNAWQFMALSNLRVWENEWYQYEKGLFEEDEYSGRKNLLSGMLSGPGYSQIWESQKQSFSPGFRSFVDSLTPPSQAGSDTHVE